MYYIYPKIFNLKHLKFDYHFSTQGPRVQFKNLLKKIRKEKPKLLCIANPNSPTGTIIKDNDIHKLIKICRESNVIC